MTELEAKAPLFPWCSSSVGVAGLPLHAPHGERCVLGIKGKSFTALKWYLNNLS